MKRIARLLLVLPLVLLINCQDNLTESPTSGSPQFAKGGKGGGGPADPAIAFSIHAGGVWVIDRDGSHKTELASNSAFNSSVSWSPFGDGTCTSPYMIVYSEIYDNALGRVEVCVADDGSVQVTALPSIELGDHFFAIRPAWSPDPTGPLGNVIALSGKLTPPNVNHSLWYVAGDGTGPPEQLWDSGAKFWSIAWRHDATQLAFVEDCSDGTRAIKILGLGVGGEVETVTTVVECGIFPFIDKLDWARTKDQLVFGASDGASTERSVYVLDLDQLQLTRLPLDRAGFPTWSPDDSQLAFVALGMASPGGRLQKIDLCEPLDSCPKRGKNLGTQALIPDWRR